MALHQVTVANLLQDRYDKLHNIVILHSSNTVEQALTKLNGHKIISAPVEFHSGQTKTYKMIDVMDIAVAVLKSNNTEIFHEPIEKLCNVSHHNNFVPINEDAPLNEAVRLLHAANTHRLVATRQPEGTMLALISQMDIVSFLKHHPEYIPSALERVPISELMTPNPICVNKETPVSVVVDHCVSNRHSGVGVLNTDGTILANFSVSDLKMLTVENYKHLMSLTVGGYLEETKKFFLKAPKMCVQSTTFSDAVKLMQQEHIHRVYVCEDHKVLGIFSTSDVINALIKHT
jgi:CBS domain-containing protein